MIQLILLLLTIYLLYYFMKYRTALLNLGALDARNIRFYVGPVFGSTIEVLVYNYIIEGISILLLVILVYSLLFGSIFNMTFYLSAIGFYLFAAIGSGRTILIQAGLFAAFLVITRNIIQPPARILDYRRLEKPYNKIKRKNLVIYGLAAAILMVVYAVYLTAVRLMINGLNMSAFKVAGLEFAKQVLSYSTGSFRLLDHALINPNTIGFHYGRLTFAAFDELLGYVFHLFNIDYPIINTYIGAFTQRNVEIGSGLYNAIYTCVFRFYYDFGIVGVMLFSFAFGLLVRKSVNQFNQLPCISSLAIMLLLMYDALCSTMNWYLSAPSQVIVLFFSFYILQREKKSCCAKLPQYASQPAEPVSGAEVDVQ